MSYFRRLNARRKAAEAAIPPAVYYMLCKLRDGTKHDFFLVARGKVAATRQSYAICRIWRAKMLYVKRWKEPARDL